MEKKIAKLKEDINILNAQNAELHTRVEKVEAVLAENEELHARLDAMEIILLAKKVLRKVG